MLGWLLAVGCVSSTRAGGGIILYSTCEMSGQDGKKRIRGKRTAPGERNRHTLVSSLLYVLCVSLDIIIIIIRVGIYIS